METAAIGEWTVLKYVEEPDFGPGPPVHTLFVIGNLGSKVDNLQGMSLLILIASQFK